MRTRTLFLLGGSTAIPQTADAFVRSADGQNSNIVFCVQSKASWEQHEAEYLPPFLKAGVSEYFVLYPHEDGAAFDETEFARLQTASGIFIGGGQTFIYQKIFAVEPMRSIISECYQKGIPVAGMSAGALIVQDACEILLKNKARTRVVDGIGLIHDNIAVHFSEREFLPSLLRQMKFTGNGIGWGLDGDACAVFEDEMFAGKLGGRVYQIMMDNFDVESYSYQLVERTKEYPLFTKGKNAETLKYSRT